MLNAEKLIVETEYEDDGLYMITIWVDDDEVIFFDRKFFILHKKIATALNDIE